MSAPFTVPRRPGIIWHATAIALTIGILAAAYCTVRYAGSPIEATILAVGLLLIVTAATGYAATRQGHAAPFMVVALLLPYLLTAVIVWAGADRVSTALEDAFSDTTSTDTTEDPPPVTEDGTGDVGDATGDGIDDNAYAGQNCNNSRPYPGAQQECLDNGGLDSDIGSGRVQGDPKFTDKNHDLVDDHYYDRVACTIQAADDTGYPQIEGGQAEFAQCVANGGSSDIMGD